MNYCSFYLKDKKSMNEFSKILSRVYLFDTIIFLIGKFGVGKTFFTKGLLNELLNYNVFIKSPSYSFVDIYFFNDIFIGHCDFYRINKISEFDDMFFNLNLNNKFFLLIEWGEKIFNRLQTPDICIYIFCYSFLDRIVILRSKTVNFNKLFF